MVSYRVAVHYIHSNLTDLHTGVRGWVTCPDLGCQLCMPCTIDIHILYHLCFYHS